MNNATDGIAVCKSGSIEASEPDLIARTHEELDPSTGDLPVENFAEALCRPVLALGLTITFVWFLRIDVVSDFLAATIWPAASAPAGSPGCWR